MAPKRPKPVQGQPHDGLIRSALESLDNVRSAVAAVLPAKLLARLDLTSLRPAPARIVDTLLHARESDALWELPFRGLDQSLWVLIRPRCSRSPTWTWSCARWECRSGSGSDSAGWACR
jgi:hypothetical protein